MSEADQPAVPPTPPAPPASQAEQPKPEPAPAPPAAAPPPAAPPQGEAKPEPRPQRPRLGPRIPMRHPGGGGERREPPPAPRPPSLEQEQQYGGRVSVKEFDAQVERELEEAMSGLSAKDMYGEPAQQRRKPAGEAKPGALKGKVISVHNADVFVD